MKCVVIFYDILIPNLPILWRTALQAAFMRCYLYPRALPPVTQGSALQAPERIQVLYDVTTLLTAQMPHIALCCLEGSTMSNRVHRRRRCARIVLYTILCLEGSTPEDVCISHYHRFYGLDGSCPVEERLDQKVCCLPQAYALAA